MAVITPHPDSLAPAIGAVVDTVVVVGDAPADILGGFARAVGEQPPPAPEPAPASGEVVVWHRGSGAAPFAVKPALHRGESRRHARW
jgi:hypothetical protein